MLSYKDFINEHKLYSEELLTNVLEDLSVYYAENSVSSFQYLAHEPNNQNDILEFMNNLETKYGELVLKNIVSNIDYNRIIKKVGGDENAFIDIFLNTYDKDYTLGGFDMVDDGNPIISYLYGWNNTHYGYIAIIDSFSTLDKYYEFIMREFKDSDSIGNIKEQVENIVIFENITYDNFRGNSNLKDFVSFGNIILIESKNKELILGVLKLDKGINYNTNIDEYIVNKLIKGKIFNYFDEFKLDTSFLEPGYLKNLVNSHKSIKKYNI